ncbi:CapA family protein [Priestia taiwanensis]|uniref:PGA biosynthesis protein CapA n=1 Tax=Priestia taiwanensis TaxID=1347902 RepID=A0A917EU70_9BACI|nr:CapA family protein [Priestia taiwanensis]MBM7365025.1 poly-gamma-glutamate synthesis protein (capsule biosynthesis protein) [Priestia taiwanensis]GGE83450.1 PGA biosynthesis protein CapA [Priestia taiwanensis]
MKRELTFQEKLLAFMKHTKKKNRKHSLIVLVLVLIFLPLLIWIERTGTAESVHIRENQKLTMTLVGDIMMGRHIENVTQQYGEGYMFRYVDSYLKNADYVSGNFEHPVLAEEPSKYEKADKYIHLHVNKEAVQAVKEAGFSVMNLANNHLMDYGAGGLHDTVSVFREAGLDYVGAGEDLQQAKGITYHDVNGVRVATLGFTDAYVKGFIATSEEPGVLSMNPELLFEQIGIAKSDARGNADLIVVHAHWGQEYDDEPSPRQQALGRAMIEAGADIIVGHHPHVLQSFEVYKEGVIFYSLGNFVFDQGWTRTKDSALVQYHLNDEGEATIDIVPLQIKEGVPRKTSNWLDKKRIFRQLTKDASIDIDWEENGGLLEVKLNHQHVIKRVKERVASEGDS